MLKIDRIIIPSISGLPGDEMLKIDRIITRSILGLSVDEMPKIDLIAWHADNGHSLLPTAVIRSNNAVGTKTQNTRGRARPWQQIDGPKTSCDNRLIGQRQSTAAKTMTERSAKDNNRSIDPPKTMHKRTPKRTQNKTISEWITGEELGKVVVISHLGCQPLWLSSHFQLPRGSPSVKQ